MNYQTFINKIPVQFGVEDAFVNDRQIHEL